MPSNFPLVIAHRGGRNWAPENTLASFSRAIEAKAGGVEFDVHRCASGELVVIHDDDLNRTTNGVGMVKDCSYAELKRLSAGAWFDQEFKAERVPLLSEVLDLFACRGENMLVNIELKNAPVIYAGIEEDLLREIESYREKMRFLVSSFDHHCLARLRALDSELELGVLAAASLVDLAAYTAKFAASHFIVAYDCLTPETIAEARESGIALMVWTVNDKYEWQRLIEQGVAAICTDTPDALIEYLALSAGSQI